MPTARRGRDLRLVSRCHVELDRPAGTVVAETEDLSPRGIYVRTDALMPIGEETDLRVTLPNGQTVALYARVAHILTPSAAHALGRHPGIGFELMGPDTPARLQLRAFLDNLKTEVTSNGLTSTTQVIVVEPSPPLRTRMARTLEAAGFKVTAVASAMEALSACSVWRPDAIVAASAMDGMTGVDLMYAMSDHPTLADVPLLLTGNESDLYRLEAFRAGVRDYIPRPFLDEELLIRVHRVATPVVSASPGLRGSLHDIALGTLMSLFEFERKSGILALMRKGELARMFMADGRILKLDAPGTGSAKQRIMKLLDWRDGQFEFAPAVVTGKDEVNIPVTALLLEHARRSDEAKASHPVIPAQLSSAAIGIPMESSMFSLPSTDKDSSFESWSGVIPMTAGTNPGFPVPTTNPGTNPGMAVNPATVTPATPTPIVPAEVVPAPVVASRQTAPMAAPAVPVAAAKPAPPPTKPSVATKPAAPTMLSSSPTPIPSVTSQASAPLPSNITKLPPEPSILTPPMGSAAVVEETVIMNAAPSGMGDDTMEDWDDDVHPLDSSGMMPIDPTTLDEPAPRPSQPPSLPPPPPIKPQASVPPPPPPKKQKAQ